MLLTMLQDPNSARRRWRRIALAAVFALGLCALVLALLLATANADGELRSVGAVTIRS